MKKIFIFAFLIITILSCSNKYNEPKDKIKGTLILGGKNGYTENRLVFKMLSIYLKENGYNITEIPEINIVSGYDALKNKHIDIYCEYTGTILSLFTNTSTPDPEESYILAKKRVAQDGMVLLNMAPSNNTYKIFLKKETAEKFNIKTFSDLTRLINTNRFNPIVGAGLECIMDHLDCLGGLQKYYGFKIPEKNIIILDPKRLYNALENSTINMAVSGTAEGQRLKYNPTILVDDKQFFSAYNIAPITREDIISKYPELPYLINKLFDKLNQDELLQISFQIDGKNEEMIYVIRNWLKKKKLIQ